MLAPALLLAVTACKPSPPPSPRYHLGAAYRAAGVWFYPSESYSLRETGLAAITPTGKDGLTANGEAYDPTAMAAGHPTLQLPAIARVTNLETGAQVTLRINDRGPIRVQRFLELTPRAAQLLQARTDGTRMRLEVLGVESLAAVANLPNAPRLALIAAPREAVRAESLSGPTTTPSGGAGQGATASEAQPDLRIPRLPETVTQLAPSPGLLWIRLDSFSRAEFAERQRARLARLAPSIEMERQGRQTLYRLRIGPLTSVEEADATLDQALRAGAPGARIVVE